MKDLLKLISKRNTEKILSHPKFPDGIHELIRKGYVAVKDENFYLTEKGENARRTGDIPELDSEDPVQSKRNEMNKSIVEFPTIESSKNKKSLFFLLLAFCIFFIKTLSNKKIFPGKKKPTSPPKRK